MAEDTMPAIEAESVDTHEEYHYELSFHALPTIAEGEVDAVVTGLKELIAKHGGAVTAEEAPERFELAYELRKSVEGVYRRFSTSLFGWVRFTLSPEEVKNLTDEVARNPKLIRHLIVRLTRREVEQPFKVFERRKKSVIVDRGEGDGERPAESTEVLEKELDQSLEGLTSK